MKTTYRIPKAIAVVVIVGLGMVHNMENKNIILEPIQQFTTNWESTQEDSDSNKTSENKFINNTKSMLITSIQHFISTI